MRECFTSHTRTRVIYLDVVVSAQITAWDTRNVTDMKGMFKGCAARRPPV